MTTLMRAQVRTLARTLALAALLAAATLAESRTTMAADGDRNAERTIAVSASGMVVVEPDLAHISTGVVTEGETAKDAIARNNAVMGKLIAGLKAGGIAARDIQISALNVEPRYTQAKDGRPAVLSGYRVTNQVRLTVRDVTKVGEVLDQAITLGANQVHGIGFDVANAETLKDEARKQAIANARRRAELYATAAGVQLGPVLQITESGHAMRPFAGAQRAAMAASVPIEAGTRTLAVEVHVTYGLK